MLDICTCIIFFIIFSDLVPDMYFQDTNTWDSCDMHYLDYMTFLDLPWFFILWSRVLVILWLCYITVTYPGHFMFIIYMSHYACTVSLYMIYLPDYSCYYYYFQFSILPNILFLCPTYCYYIFIFSPYCFVYSCWSASDGPLLYFSVFRSESRYRELFIDHILVQLFSGEFSFLSWLALFRYSGWYYLWFSFSYIWFYPCA